MEVKVKWADGSITTYTEFNSVEECVARVWGSAGLPKEGVEVMGDLPPAGAPAAKPVRKSKSKE